jgi:hypothetical protein
MADFLENTNIHAYIKLGNFLNSRGKINTAINIADSEAVMG